MFQIEFRLFFSSPVFLGLMKRQAARKVQESEARDTCRIAGCIPLLSGLARVFWRGSYTKRQKSYAKNLFSAVLPNCEVAENTDFARTSVGLELPVGSSFVQVSRICLYSAPYIGWVKQNGESL